MSEKSSKLEKDNETKNKRSKSTSGFQGKGYTQYESI